MESRFKNAALFGGCVFLCSGIASAQTGTLENPKPQATKSGVGVISGWHCDADRITASIDNRAPIVVPYGSPRGDTRSICGDADNGFALQVNYNLYGEGTHLVQAFADGEKFAETRFEVTTFGLPFLKGKTGTFNLEDFPEVGRSTVVAWEESTQGFQVQGTRNNFGNGLNGEYALQRFSLQTTDEIVHTDQSNIAATGTMTIVNGSMRQSFDLRVNDQRQTVSVQARCDDYGYRLSCVTAGGQRSSVVLVKRNDREVITSSTLYVEGRYVTEIDHWVKTANFAGGTLSAVPASADLPSAFTPIGLGAHEALTRTDRLP